MDWNRNEWKLNERERKSYTIQKLQTMITNGLLCIHIIFIANGFSLSLVCWFFSSIAISQRTTELVVFILLCVCMDLSYSRRYYVYYFHSTPWKSIVIYDDMVCCVMPVCVCVCTIHTLWTAKTPDLFIFRLIYVILQKSPLSLPTTYISICICYWFFIRIVLELALLHEIFGQKWLACEISRFLHFDFPF